MKRAALALLVMTVLGAGSTAAAVGYDIPILYSARHIGAAGAAVGGVDDSSAIFHNPAGMGQIGKGNLLLDVSLLTGGLRFDWNQFSLMSDFEWGFNSQNDRIAIETVDVDGNPGSIANVFEWKDQWTLRTGVEYRVYEEKIPLRLGFIYDSKATNFKYPSGFSTPPCPHLFPDCWHRLRPRPMGDQHRVRASFRKGAHRRSGQPPDTNYAGRFIDPRRTHR